MTPQLYLRVSLAVVVTIFTYSLHCQPRHSLQLLNGSWELTHYLPDGNEPDQWKTYGDSILYQKHLTEDHFFWFKYDQRNNKLLGMGGGNYEIKAGKYVEDIQFFSPPGSSERGQAIPFDFELEDNSWHHTGYAKVMNLDENSGKIVVIDSSKIEEKWVRIEPVNPHNSTLRGTWELISYREKQDGHYIEYPAYVGYIKLITDTHFAWVYFSRNDDEIYAAGSGTYTHHQNSYTETINMIYPENSGSLGLTVPFNIRLENNQWKHVGEIPLMNDESLNNNARKLSLVDEIWQAHQE